MTLKELIEAKRAEVAEHRKAYDASLARQRGIINNARDEGRDQLTRLETEEITSLRSSAEVAMRQHDAAKRGLDDLERVAAEEERLQREAQETHETGAGNGAGSEGGGNGGQGGTSPAGAARGYDRQHRVTSEERTYAPHRERGFDASTGRFRRGAKPGADFERDVAAAFLGDYEAQERLRQHMREEKVERGIYLERALTGPNLPGQQSRAVGTGAFSGLTVPQYLTDMYAPAAAAKRPFADVMTHHDLPETGMTVNISRITTPSAVGLQGTENTAVTNQDMDDTLLTFGVQTNAGQQTMSRQSIERAAGTEPIVMDDLYRRYNSGLDSTLINQATTGLSAVASSIAYTDASPTVVEFAPLISQAAANVETTMLDLGSGDIIAVMASRRWFWINQALSSSWPLMSQPNTLAQTLGANYGEVYGRGLRGILPNNIPVIVDANVALNGGTGTNQDEVYVLDRAESHLWEDPTAPMFIRAEQPAAASLGVLLVLYGYFAYTHSRLLNAQKIAGTGLVTPTWTGV